MASASATRKSIKTHFPLGSVLSRGRDNPITLHSVDDAVFRSIWSLVAETMVVDGDLSRETKERIAEMVSTKNSCPVCVVAHSMMGVAAHRDAAKNGNADPSSDEIAALEFAESLVNATCTTTTGAADSGDCSLGAASIATNSRKNLSSKAKAEIALVILVFEHMNRVVSALMGTEMSTAMFGVPRPLARTMEKRSVMGVLSKIMAPILSRGLSKKRQEGITSNLFKQEIESGKSDFELPSHLAFAKVAGTERGRALARVVQLDESLYERHLTKDVPQCVVDFLEDPANVPPQGNLISPTKRINWIMTIMRKKFQETLGNDQYETVAMVLLQVSFTPSSVFRSLDYKALVKGVGAKQARLIVIWWSIKVTLKDAKGLSQEMAVQYLCASEPNTQK